MVDRNEKRPPLTGIAEYVHLFEVCSFLDFAAPSGNLHALCVVPFIEINHYLQEPTETPPKAVVETKEEKRARRRKEKEELLAYKIEQGIAMWNPAEHENATKDPYKTLFVSRIVGFISNHSFRSTLHVCFTNNLLKFNWL